MSDKNFNPLLQTTAAVSGDDLVTLTDANGNQITQKVPGAWQAAQEALKKTAGVMSMGYQIQTGSVECISFPKTPEEDSSPLTSGDVIERLCKLQREVFEKIGANCTADCFCGRSGFWVSGGDYDGTYEHGYRNDGRVLEFIEQAVREKLAQRSEQL